MSVSHTCQLPGIDQKVGLLQVGTASLNLLKGDEHLRLKKILGDSFSEEAVEGLRPVLQECTQLFCKR